MGMGMGLRGLECELAKVTALPMPLYITGVAEGRNEWEYICRDAGMTITGPWLF